MAVFRIEINVVDGDKGWKINEGEYVKKFCQSAHKYSYNPFQNNNGIIEIEFNIDEWNRIENIFPHKLFQFNEEIFIKDNMLCVTNHTAYLNEIRESLPDICDTKIMKEQDKVYLISTKKYIDELIVELLKNRIGSINSDDFEFYEPTLKLYYKKGKLTKLKIV